MAAAHRDQIKALLANGEMHTDEVIAKMPDVKVSTIKKELGKLKKDGEIVTPPGRRSWYRLPTDTSAAAETHASDADTDTSLKRTEADNEVTINKALLLFDKVLDDAAETIEGELYTKATMSDKIDLIKSLRWLGATLDQLMKRWNLEHHGYDTNTRQAQEDAKAKTEERQKEALKDAPLEDTIQIVGMYDPEAKALIDCIPSSLKSMTDEEKEDVTV